MLTLLDSFALAHYDAEFKHHKPLTQSTTLYYPNKSTLNNGLTRFLLACS